MQGALGRCVTRGGSIGFLTNCFGCVISVACPICPALVLPRGAAGGILRDSDGLHFFGNRRGFLIVDRVFPCTVVVSESRRQIWGICAPLMVCHSRDEPGRVFVCLDTNGLICPWQQRRSRGQDICIPKKVAMYGPPFFSPQGLTSPCSSCVSNQEIKLSSPFQVRTIPNTSRGTPLNR